MATQVSPGVSISEVDRSDALTQVALTEGAVAGHFTWGPVGLVRTVSSEAQLAAQFGKPDNNSAPYFFTGANFLSYSNTLRVSRVVDEDEARAATAENSETPISASETYSVVGGSNILTTTGGNTAALFPGLTVLLGNSTTSNIEVTVVSVNSTAAILTSNASISVTAGNAYPYGILIKNEDHYEQSSTLNSGLAGVGPWAAKYPGVLGNSLRVDVCASANAFKQENSTVNSVATANITAGSANTTLTFAADIDELLQVGDILTVNVGGVKEEREVLSLTNATAVVVNAAFSAAITDAPFNRRWKYAKLFSAAPGTSDFVTTYGGSTDEIHVVVVDRLGVFSSTPGEVLERYQGLSVAANALREDGAANYYKEVINRTSPYIWWTGHPTGGSNWGDDASTTFDTMAQVQRWTLKGGSAGGTLSLGDLQSGFLLLADEQVSASFIMGASANAALATYIINNVVEPKRYSMGFFSPNMADVVNNAGGEVDSIIAYREALPSTSYAVMDSGWKYQYDKYNRVYRYVPLNGDIAGLAARTDQIAESWFSPAGFTRGALKIGNLIKLAFNPNQTQRDDLYLAGVNSVVSFPGEGTVLYGDKTLLRKPSAFDRINVRRLFIALEKTIERSAKYQMFEQNDEFTRNMFINMIEPYLRSVRGRRGISDFYVVCDSTNNPPDVIDRNEFRADIYVKPIRSVNFINLNFIAVRSDVSFSEVITNLS